MPDQLSGAGTLAFITDNFPNLKELAINVLFPDKSIDDWKMRFIGTTISNIPTISLLKKRGVTVVIQAVPNKIKIRAWNPLKNFLPASYM